MNNNRISYIITDNGVTAIIDGAQHTLTRDNASYNEVVDAIVSKENPSDIADLFVAANAVKRYTNGAVAISEDGSTLTYNGEVVHNVVVDRIFLFMKEGLPVEPLIAFLGRLLANPSRRSVEELYTFLEHKNLPITEDGKFLAYKGVNVDYTDVHTGTFSNKPGTTQQMRRNDVDDDFRRGCSYGFHVGSLEYATSFGSKTVIVEVDPADVVSVPSECSCQKLRTAKYRVIEDFQGALEKPLYPANPTSVYNDSAFGGGW